MATDVKNITKREKRKASPDKKPWIVRFGRDIKMHKGAYMLALPVILFYILFCYKPMGGLIIAFKNYAPIKGIWGSSWAGFSHFEDFLTNPYFWRLMKNTLTISISSLIFSFPAPIILALLLNEVRNKLFLRGSQMIMYLPHFISLVVICGMVIQFTGSDGIINDFLAIFGVERKSFLNYPEYFVPVYIISDIWAGIGWGSIIYMAALTGIDSSLYEAAVIDGAGRWKQTIYVTLPGILPTIIVMFLMRVGQLLSVGYEKIILLYNPLTYETADIISTYVYRKGLLEQSYSFSSAVGLFNSIISFILLTFANGMSKRLGEGSLW
ncbi:MAG: sugar ABC transporter permease [Clostridia bacterium]|nr:sugar ABC transporter permease [Clostridia bacterium]